MKRDAKCNPSMCIEQISETSESSEFLGDWQNFECEDDDSSSHELQQEDNETQIDDCVEDTKTESSDNDTEIDDCVEEERKSYLLQWILIIFLKIHYRFNLTKNAASAILSFVSLIFSFISHPLSSIFPKTVSSAMSATGCHRSLPKTIYVVCPREKCNALYKIAINLYTRVIRQGMWSKSGV